MYPKKRGARSARIFLFVVIALSIFSVDCLSEELQSAWISEPIQIDGGMAEWTDLPKTYFEKENVLVGVCNDDENLYILFRFGNEAWAHAIRISGITLWFENSGKKKKEVGIEYTGGPHPPAMRGPEMGAPPGEFRGEVPIGENERRMQKPEFMHDRINVVHKKESSEITASADGSDGIAVSATTDRKFFTYEFSIPLTEREGYVYAIGTEPGRLLSIGLEWGAVNEEDLQRLGEQNGDRSEGGGRGDMGRMRKGGQDSGGRQGDSAGSGWGGGMGPGGGMRPEGGGSMPGSRLQTTEKEEVWLQITLALPTADAQ